MLNYLLNINPIYQALLAGIFTWFLTALGAATIVLFKRDNKTIMDIMLTIAAGVMVAASFFSLLLPAIEMAENLDMCVWLIITLGVIFGGLLILITNKIFDRLTIKKKKSNNIKRCLTLILSITMHNIPEGLAIGVAFGSIIYGLDGVTILTAWLLAIGIGIQNFPEGAAVSLPLARDGLNKKQSFFLGQLSGIVEPLASFIGALIVIKVRILLPFLLSFAAGAMLYVVVIELIPESQKSKFKNLNTFFFLIGFSIMMILDISLG